MADRLEKYRGMRDAARTPEPMGDGPAGEPGGRFVVQEHHATRLHWDLRLERDGVLVSFAIPNGLPPDPGQNRKAVHTEDHPLEYLGFHGEIPKGSYGAGRMTIWDQGTYDCLKWSDRKIEVALHGERGLAQGRYALFATGRDGDGPFVKDWMIHRMDPPADPGREPLPESVVPMLASIGRLPADEEGWAFEVKWDGVRAIAFSEPGRLRFQSRNLRDITGQYPELSKLNRALSHHSAVLDGEIVAFDAEGRPSFERLQRRMHVGSESAARRLSRDNPVAYVIFDLLHLDGRSIMGRPYEERRRELEELGLEGPHWQTPDHVVGQGEALLRASAQQGLEGIVAKRLDAPYEPGRRGGAWRKIKNTRRQEFVIGGWHPGEGRRRERIGALLVGVRDQGALRYAGKVGTGFTDAELERLAALLGPLRRDRSPFDGPSGPRGAVFVEPRLVAEVEFVEWTREGMLRAPSYKGLRDDKEPGDVTAEHPGEVTLADPEPAGRNGLEVTVEGRRLKLSNLDKVLYPQAGFTKGDVIDFYRRIAPVVLPHLRGRPLTLKRYPDGVEGQHFYEKQCPRHRPDWVATADVPSTRKTITFCLCEDAATLVWLANLADLELHPYLHRAAEPSRPTMLVFDLDPGPPAGIVECARVGLWLQGMFAGLGLESFAKTSGSKGLQVYLPLNHPDVGYEQTKPFARTVAELLESSEPDLVVSRMTKALRPGKVLVDWSQNDEHKTTVGVYSLRAKDRPTVSTPVTWAEVRACAEVRDPELLVFDAAGVLERVSEHGDLFAPVLTLVQRLPAGA